MNENVCYFDPNSVEDISNTIQNVLFSDTMKKNLVKGAKSVLPNFSWSRCAALTLENYKI